MMLVGRSTSGSRFIFDDATYRLLPTSQPPALLAPRSLKSLMLPPKALGHRKAITISFLHYNVHESLLYRP